MNRIIGLFLLLTLCSSVVEAQRYPKRKIRKDLADLPGFENAFIGFLLVDPEKRKPIFEQYADKHMTPGSTTKLFTVYGAMEYLPEKLPALEYLEKGDSLIFWSTGYPLTLHPDHLDSTVIEFLESTNKKLFYWLRPTEDQRFGPGWGWDDYPYYYGAEKSVFPIYGNSVKFILDNRNKTYTMSPAYRGFQVLVDSLNASRSQVTRDEWWNEFHIQYADKDNLDTLIRSFHSSNALTQELLSDAIGKNIHSISLDSRPEEFQTLEGLLADSLYKWTLQPSDNLFAEELLLMISGQQSDTLSTKKAIDHLLKKDPVLFTIEDDQDLVWRDGSGLSRYNMFTPKSFHVLLNTLRLYYGQDRIFELLPQGGTSGTLKDWYGSYVYAKTGSLSNNHALVGYIQTEKGKMLQFVLMANHYTAPTSQIRKSIGIILEKIKKAY